MGEIREGVGENGSSQTSCEGMARYAVTSTAVGREEPQALYFQLFLLVVFGLSWGRIFCGVAVAQCAVAAPLWASMAVGKIRYKSL